MRRTMTLIGIVLTAIIVVGVAVVVLSAAGANRVRSPTSSAGKAEASAVSRLLTGIPQSGNTLGSSSAKVTVTEYGDLECPICRDFALGAQQQLIANDVRAGKVELVYKSLCTATCNGPNQAIFPTQQAAAIAAGQQGKEWNYVELFYHQQGSEGTSYVNDSYLNALAQRNTRPELLPVAVGAPAELARRAGHRRPARRPKALATTARRPSSCNGPKGQAPAIVGETSYSSLRVGDQKGAVTSTATAVQAAARPGELGPPAAHRGHRDLHRRPRHRGLPHLRSLRGAQSRLPVQRRL